MSDTNTKIENPLSKVDWDDFLETLQEQKCVLFLGQGAFAAPGGDDMEIALRQWLDVENPEHPHLHVQNPDGFFLFKKNRFKRRLITEIKDFYNQSFPETEAQFGRLARLPFSMIITLTPDNILSRIFDTMGYEYQSDFYFRKRRAAGHFDKPTKEKPLIYNLLGNIEEPESLVLTHSDFFDYLESVFIGNSMNQDLMDELEGMERFIFLGLPYEKWYFQLLLRVLSMHTDRFKEVERLALKEFEDSHLHKLYTEDFKIEFFPVKTEEFIGEVYRRCEAGSLLKPLPKVDPDLAQLPDPNPKELREWIAKGNTKKAILHFKVYLDRRKPQSASLLNDLIVLRNQYNVLRQREQRGTIDSRDYVVENNQITERLLELITQAKVSKSYE